MDLDSWLRTSHASACNAIIHASTVVPFATLLPKDPAAWVSTDSAEWWAGGWGAQREHHTGWLASMHSTLHVFMFNLPHPQQAMTTWSVLLTAIKANIPACLLVKLILIRDSSIQARCVRQQKQLVP